ncbi:hypothetical protein [Kalamiella sp. sgz302252]|uniref:hypothetical protein n=1 Tax=Pantoea sp. sgz302252 TaxID=3341827 RepID=UPI0036D3892F
MAIQRKSISWVDFRLKFEDSCRAYGFNADKIDALSTDIFELVAKWRADGFVDIYENGDKPAHGMIKSSRKDASGRIYECYTEFYHSRITPGADDPLLLLTFENVADDPFPWLVLESIIKHDQYFGRKGKAKRMVNHLNALREAVARRINYARKKFKMMFIKNLK